MKGRLFDRVMTRMVKRGTLDITLSSGETVRFGEATAGYPDVA